MENARKESLVICPITGESAPLSKVIKVGKYNATWLDSSKMWTTINLPSIDELSSAYLSFNAGEHSRKNFTSYLAQSKIILSRELGEMAVEPTHFSNLSLLDYGCGGGHFIAAGNELGIKAMGMDLDTDAVRDAINKGLNVVEGVLPRDIDKIGNQKFDLIKVSHVLEHVPNLSELIDSLISLLNPNGRLIINIPNQESFPSKLKIFLRFFGLKKNEYGYLQPPIHLHGFTQDSFRVIAFKKKLKIISMYEYSPLDLENFPTSDTYWESIPIQKIIYKIAHFLKSYGYLTVILGVQDVV